MGNNLFKFMSAAIFILILGGCAGVQTDPLVSFEQMLTTAGFRVMAADTPGKLATLQALPAKRIVARTKGGRVYYLCADPDQKVLYVGNQQAYRAYLDQRMAKEEARGSHESTVARMDDMEMDYDYQMQMDDLF